MSKTMTVTVTANKAGKASVQNGKSVKGVRVTMTASEATSFQTESVGSALQVAMLVSDRRTTDPAFSSCQCQGYEDVFTFNRWKAQGMSVRKGQKSLRISSWVRIKGTDGSEGAVIPTSVCLFCRCQVDPIK